MCRLGAQPLGCHGRGLLRGRSGWGVHAPEGGRRPSLPAGTDPAVCASGRLRPSADARVPDALQDPVLGREHRHRCGPPALVDVRQHGGRGDEHPAGIPRAVSPHGRQEVPGTARQPAAGGWLSRAGADPGAPVPAARPCLLLFTPHSSPVPSLVPGLRPGRPCWLVRPLPAPPCRLPGVAPLSGPDRAAGWGCRPLVAPCPSHLGGSFQGPVTATWVGCAGDLVVVPTGGLWGLQWPMDGAGFSHFGASAILA